MVGRILHAEAILTYPIPKPEETAFAHVSREPLPLGMTGLVVGAMFSATMSSLDTSLNASAALLVRDFAPLIFKSADVHLSDAAALRLSKNVTGSGSKK